MPQLPAVGTIHRQNVSRRRGGQSTTLCCRSWAVLHPYHEPSRPKLKCTALNDVSSQLAPDL